MADSIQNTSATILAGYERALDTELSEEKTNELQSHKETEHLDRGETLWELSKRYHVDVKAITAANGWKSVEDLKRGMQEGRNIVIPTGKGLGSKPHEVKLGGTGADGEKVTLASVMAEYRVSEQQIRAANHHDLATRAFTDTDTFYVPNRRGGKAESGATDAVAPAPAPPAPPTPPAAKTHKQTVGADGGEKPAELAARYRMTAQEFASANPGLKTAADGTLVKGTPVNVVTAEGDEYQPVPNKWPPNVKKADLLKALEKMGHDPADVTAANQHLMSTKGGPGEGAVLWLPPFKPGTPQFQEVAAAAQQEREAAAAFAAKPKPETVKVWTVAGESSIAEFAMRHRIPVETLIRFNPGIERVLDQKGVPKKGTELRVPIGEGWGTLGRVYTWKPDNKPARIDELAKKYGVTREDIIVANKQLFDGREPKAGDKIYIPSPAPAPAPAPAPVSTAQSEATPAPTAPRPSAQGEA